MTAKGKPAKDTGKGRRPKVVKETVRDLNPDKEGQKVKGGGVPRPDRGCS